MTKLVASAACLLGSAIHSQAASTNVVLIISDDHHWGDYGFMGHPHIRTPYLDRLSREGLAFRHGYAPWSLCCPSLASIITGGYPREHLITGNDPPRPESIPDIDFYNSEAFRQGRREMVKNHAVLIASRVAALKTKLDTWWSGESK